jgi:lipoate-protein ligase A
MRPSGWETTIRSGPAGELHGLALPSDGGRHLWILEPARPALVLGSTQSEAVADGDVLRERGIDLVRRRSGGGAVLLVPGRTLWADLVIPRSDPLWQEDVTASFRWLGHAWRRALAARGMIADVNGADPASSGPVETPWSTLVCFAGVGSGEVLAGGRKVVGLSQRRTRSVARFQCVVELSPPAGGPDGGGGAAAGAGASLAVETVDLLAAPGDPAARAELRAWLWAHTAPVATGRDELVSALFAALPAPL